ncbi:hypothetical protein ABEG18_13140 [Alsobacter sp. KACC 23698]|uniref:Uncharacterized protein n=1 Tax=Alsobacter sp. KACC 23698 TaxID=3149229 RepID=A0AAU7J8I8_9HYPH
MTPLIAQADAVSLQASGLEARISRLLDPDRKGAPWPTHDIEQKRVRLAELRDAAKTLYSLAKAQSHADSTSAAA